jgi:hypothetical protein
LARRILVIGHTGLIGRDLFSQKTDLTLIPAKMRFDLENTTQQSALVHEAKNHGCDAILNLAWQANNLADYHDLDINFNWSEATDSLAKLSVQQNLRLFLVGTCLDSGLTYQNKYVQSKILLKTKLKKEIGSGYITWIRPFYIVNIESRRPRVVSSIFLGDEILSPKSANDYIVSKDVSAGIQTILGKNLQGEIDIGTGFRTTNEELARAISSKFTIPPLKFGNSPIAVGSVADSTVLRSQGWHPNHSLDLFGGRK